MKRYLAAALTLILSCAMAIGAPAAKSPPATKPATRPANRLATAPSKNPYLEEWLAQPLPIPELKATATQPTKPGASDAIPSPAEMMRKIKAQQSAHDKLPKVAHVDLNNPVMEKSPDFTLFGDNNLITMHGLLDRLRQARDDKALRAVLITVGETQFNTSQAMEIRAALQELKKAGKRTFVYADSYDTTAYIAASGATDLCMLDAGQIMMLGVSIEPMFLRGLFEKVGVKADFVQVGEFKGADEMYTRTELSPESKGELTRLADGLYDTIVDTVAHSRNIPRNSVKSLIDDVFVSGKQAKTRGLIDHLLSEDDLRAMLEKELGGGGEINLLPNYAVPQRDKLDFSNPFALMQQMMNKKVDKSSKPVIALIHAEGVIVDGRSEDTLFGPSGNIGAENMRKAFRMATRDENVKAIVLRIDSPGGSALASEVMWQAVNTAAAEKPVIVSVGSMAASGGYYLASAGDYIFADSTAIVGSIGVVGGKFVLTGLFDKIGISTDSVSRGKNADLFSMQKEWNDRQRRLVTNWMKSTYELFTERVMTNRKDKIKDIDAVARGRIFLAKQAKELGMIDEIGGLNDAVRFAAREADLNDYDLKPIPGSKSLMDLLSGAAASDADAQMPWRPSIKINVDSPLLAMPAPMRKLIGQQLQLMQIMEKRPIMLVAPISVHVK